MTDPNFAHRRDEAFILIGLSKLYSARELVMDATLDIAISMEKTMKVNYQLGQMQVNDVKAVQVNDSVRKAHALMDEFNVDQIPIVNEGGALVGVVTRRRLVHIREKEWNEVLVGEIDWPEFDSRALLQESSTLLDSVIEYLFANDFVLISDGSEKVMGIVTINDVARFLYRQMS